MIVSHNDIIFCYDFDRLTPDGLLYDYGKFGLHATAGAAGAAPTRQLDGSYYFDGGDYFALSGASQTRFYANAPTGVVTWLSVSVSLYLGRSVLFSTLVNDGVWYGLEHTIWTQPGTFQGSLNYHCDAGLTQQSYSSVQYTSYRNLVLAMICGGSGTKYGLVNGTTFDTVAAVGTGVSYGSSPAPAIGRRPDASASSTMRLYYLCLINKAISSSDMAELSSMMMDGQKPFCMR